MLFHHSCHEPEGRAEVRHPISDDQDVRVPVPDFFESADVRKRIGRIQQGSTLYRNGLIIFCYELCLSRKEELGILSLEIECSDNMLFAQFTIKACVKLRDSSSIGVETGQYSDFQ
jgi:hypothetical protein